MSVREILTAIAELPEEERQAVLAALDVQYQHPEEETPEEVERVRALVDEGLAASERGEVVGWDYEEFLRRARERYAESTL